MFQYSTTLPVAEGAACSRPSKGTCAACRWMQSLRAPRLPNSSSSWDCSATPQRMLQTHRSKQGRSIQAELASELSKHSAGACQVQPRRQRRCSKAARKIGSIHLTEVSNSTNNDSMMEVTQRQRRGSPVPPKRTDELDVAMDKPRTLNHIRLHSQAGSWQAEHLEKPGSVSR